MSMRTNARFWVYVNGGPVKITLRPGQQLSWSCGGPTDEGWSRESETWGYDCEDHVGEVFRQWCHDGRDCDGRLTREGEDVCDLADLRREWPGGLDDMSQAERDGWRDVRWPAWRKAKSCQYDEYAEAAGY